MGVPLVTASGCIRAGRLHLHDRRMFDHAVRGLKDGWEVEIEITRLRATRSVQQNRYYWGVVIHALHQYTGYTPAELHDICKAKFLPRELAIAGTNGEVVEAFVLGGSTRALNTADFARYVDAIREWASAAIDLYIPDADDAGYGAGV